jgi:hypothetical protein
MRNPSGIGFLVIGLVIGFALGWLIPRYGALLHPPAAPGAAVLPFQLEDRFCKETDCLGRAYLPEHLRYRTPPPSPNRTPPPSPVILNALSNMSVNGGGNEQSSGGPKSPSAGGKKAASHALFAITIPEDQDDGYQRRRMQTLYLDAGDDTKADAAKHYLIVTCYYNDSATRFCEIPPGTPIPGVTPKP